MGGGCVVGGRGVFKIKGGGGGRGVGGVGVRVTF